MARPILVFILANILITLVALILSDASARVGVLRPENQILPKLAELGALGLGLGLVSSLAGGKFDGELVTLSTVFVLLLDLDHIPSVLGLAQPIRPAHSLGFLLLVMANFAIFLGRARNMELVLSYSFLGHMGADAGLFGPLEPVSFTYVSLEPFRLPFLICAVALALATGYFRREKRRA